MKNILFIIIPIIVGISISFPFIINSTSSNMGPLNGITSDLQLQKILDACDTTKWHSSLLVTHFNDTHYINNHTCEWMPKRISWEDRSMIDIELYRVFDSCTNDSPQDRMNYGLRYINETHIFSNQGCEWKKIGNFTGQIENEN